jgi:sulfur carrier protein ThiS
MQQQRTVYSNNQGKNAAPAGTVTVAALGMRHIVAPGRSVAATLRELGLSPAPYQAVRVNAEEIRDLSARVLRADDMLTITNVVRGGS